MKLLTLLYFWDSFKLLLFSILSHIGSLESIEVRFEACFGFGKPIVPGCKVLEPVFVLRPSRPLLPW